MGTIRAICISGERGTEKKEVEQARVLAGWGIEGDAHGGHWHRQVSLLSYERIQEFQQKGADIAFGAFGENLVVEGIDCKSLPLGTRFRCGEVLLELTQHGKECHSHCEIYQRMGDCIMPREGVFAVVLCGGTIHRGDRIEVIPDKLYQTIADREADSSCLLVTALDGSHRGERSLWIDGVIRWSNAADDFLKKQERELLALSGSCLLERGASRLFCEVIGGQKRLVICGAGHVSIPIILLGKQMGFAVTVIDDRPFFANAARRAEADTVLCDSFEAAMEQIEGSRDTYFVIVTRGHRYDLDCLRLALQKPNGYIGMMGSKKRVRMVKDFLREEGVDDTLLERVHAPIGLSIGAQTPEEIAVSIMAEIIQEKNEKKRVSGYDKELLAFLTGKDTAQQKAVLCTIVSKKGSAPRELGTKMLVFPDGGIVGTIGGGCAESGIIQIALQMLREQERAPRLEMVDMTGREAEELGMVCGGTILVWMEYVES